MAWVKDGLSVGVVDYAAMLYAVGVKMLRIGLKIVAIGLGCQARVYVMGERFMFTYRCDGCRLGMR